MSIETDAGVGHAYAQSSTGEAEHWAEQSRIDGSPADPPWDWLRTLEINQVCRGLPMWTRPS